MTQLRHRRTEISLAVLLGSAPWVDAQTPVLPSSGVLAMTLQRPDASYATLSTISPPGAPFRNGVEVRVLRTPEFPWSVQLNLPTTGSVALNDVLLATFTMRRASTVPDEGVSTLVFERAGTPWNKSVERTLVEGEGTWQDWHIAFKADGDYAAGAAQVNLQLGYTPQTLQFGNLSVLNYGKTVNIEDLPNDFTYSGRAPDAAWRAPAAERIELYRKANATVHVVNPYGQPVAGAEVHARLTRHAFGFGSAVAAWALFNTGNDGERYREIAGQWFNRVVLENDLKWPNWESNRSRALNAVQWLRQRGIEVRGHNLIWPGWSFMPADLPQLADNPPALRTRINNHFADIAGALRQQIVEWDVINEPWRNHDVQDVLGDSEMVSWFQQARALDPSALLYLNEYGNLEVPSRFDSHYQGNLDALGYLQSQGAPVDGFGFQSHFGAFLTGPAELYERFEAHAAFGVQLAITEFDVDTSNEAVQADYTRDLLTVAFSHPSMTGVLMWGFWEGAHWKPNAALFRRDWTPKPNALAWSNVVFNTWSTDVRQIADTEGSSSFRGFKGTYELTATLGNYTGSATTRFTNDTQIDLAIPGFPPRLLISSTPTAVQLAWPTAAAGFALETSPTEPPLTWSLVTVDPVPQDGLQTVSIPPSETARLYRLTQLRAGTGH